MRGKNNSSGGSDSKNDNSPRKKRKINNSTIDDISLKDSFNTNDEMSPEDSEIMLRILSKYKPKTRANFLKKAQERLSSELTEETITPKKRPKRKDAYRSKDSPLRTRNRVLRSTTKAKPKLTIEDAKADYASRANRATTGIGKQGEHVSAYTLFEELIYSAIEGRTIKEASTLLLEKFKQLSISKNLTSQITEIITKNQAEIEDKLILRDTRKDITSNLRACNDYEENKDDQKSDASRAVVFNVVGEKSIANTREAIKRWNLSLYTPAVVNIIDACMVDTNRMLYASFPKERMPKNPHTSNEGHHKNKLRYLSDLLKNIHEIRCLRSLESKSKPESKEAILLRKSRVMEVLKDVSVLSLLKKHWNIEKELIQSYTDYEISVSNKRKSLDDLLLITKYQFIVDKVCGLFWHPKVNEEETKAAFDKKQKSKSPYKKGSIPRDNNLDILYQVVSRHIVLIFNAFDGLLFLDPQTKNMIIDGFLTNSILENWQTVKEHKEDEKEEVAKAVDYGWKTDIAKTMKQKNPSDAQILEHLKNQLLKYVVLDTENNRFCMNSSKEGKKEGKKEFGINTSNDSNNDIPLNLDIPMPSLNSPKVVDKSSTNQNNQNSSR